MVEPGLSSPWIGERFVGCNSRKSGVRVQNYSGLQVERGMNVTFGGVLSVGRLAEVKRVSLRRGFWFRALNRVERGVLDLTMRCVDSIRSAKLATVVKAILDKLKLAMESVVERMVRVVGRPLAQKNSGIAVGWGNCSASGWAEDRGYARYLALCFSSKLAVT
jgi:hypothetical protein